MSEEELDLEKLERCMNSLGEKFIKWPYNFFTESDAHSFLYYYMFRSAHRSLKIQYSTIDKSVKTVLVHREYPTSFRYKKKEMIVSQDGGRGHYDLAILEPRFVREHSIDTVIGKDFKKTAKSEKHHLLAALEFKFIHSPLNKNLRDEIKRDVIKLHWAVTLEPPQSQGAYLLVFNRCRHEQNLITDFYDWSESSHPLVKMLYVESVIADKKYKKVMFRGDWTWRAPFLLKYRE